MQKIQLGKNTSKILNSGEWTFYLKLDSKVKIGWRTEGKTILSKICIRSHWQNGRNTQKKLAISKRELGSSKHYT